MQRSHILFYKGQVYNEHEAVLSFTDGSIFPFDGPTSYLVTVHNQGSDTVKEENTRKVHPPPCGFQSETIFPHIHMLFSSPSRYKSVCKG